MTNTPVHPVDEPEPRVEQARSRVAEVDDDLEADNKAGVRGLTFEQFRQCMELKASIVHRNNMHSAASRTLKEQKNRIDAEERAMEEARGKILPGEESAVFAFNARVKKQRIKMQAFNQQIDAYNAEVKKTKTAGQSFSVGCADRPFRTNDIERLPPELQVVAKDGTEHFDLPAYFSDDPPPTPRPEAVKNLDLNY